MLQNYVSPGKCSVAIVGFEATNQAGEPAGLTPTAKCFLEVTLPKHHLANRKRLNMTSLDLKMSQTKYAVS
jgi:hypothetical protein